MAPSSSKANYKTYEAQARMVRAIVAAHPDVKWNYKDISACYGSDMTDHALNHRFRRLRAQSIIIREGRLKGLDMKNLVHENDLPATQEAVDKKNIAKYFGQSTADGIQFQFRSYKKDADVLKSVQQKGGNVANCLSLGGGSGGGGGGGGGSVFTTPAKSTPSKSTGHRSGTARKRTLTPLIKRSSSDDDDEEDDTDAFEDAWEERDETPSKRPKFGATPVQKTGTPSRQAAARANATIADAAAQIQSSESSTEADTPVTSHNQLPPTTVAPSSIFGPGASKPAVEHRELSTIFANDPMVSGASPPSSYYETARLSPNDAFYYDVNIDNLLDPGEI